MEEFLRSVRSKINDDLVSWEVENSAAKALGLSPAQAQLCLLEAELWPARYQRNRRMLSTKNQLQLCCSTVAVIGCGGLGGYIIEELARLGIGCIVAVDPDVFEEHNLNRQLLSAPDLLGKSKAQVAVERVRFINPAVTVRVEERAYGPECGREILNKVMVAVDALDNLAVRRQLGDDCRDLGIPWVHGAIAGWFGQIATLYPGDRLPERIGEACSAHRGVEAQLGNPSFTPAVVASLQVAEVAKILIGVGETLRHRLLTIDLRDMEFVEIPY